MASAHWSRRRPETRRGRSRELQSLLAEQNRILQARKEALRSGVTAEMVGATDLEEHSVDAEEVEVGVSVLELTSQTVRSIESALERLEAGAYGTCTDCNSVISSVRLRALPFADRCRACQEKRDSAIALPAGRPTSPWGDPAASAVSDPGAWLRGRAANPGRL